jgi:phytoene desaturase
MVIDRLEKITQQAIRDHVIFRRSYAHNDFIADYHAYRGNAYGLANTLKQTANFRPSIINNKIRNLFFAGQLTVPGPGVPPAIISGQVVAKVIRGRVRNL